MDDTVTPGEFRIQAIPAIVDLLSRAASTLQDITIEYKDFVLGHQMETLPPMPLLRVLSFKYITIDGHSLATVLSKCPVLELLELEQVDSSEGNNFQHWRPIFDAIKQHGKSSPQGAHLQVEYNISLAWQENHFLHFWHIVGDAGYDDFNLAWHPEDAIVRMLSNYVSGHGDWDVDYHWLTYAE